MKLAALILVLAPALAGVASAQVVTNYSTLDLATMYANSPAVRVASRTPPAAVQTVQTTSAPIVLTSRVIEPAYASQPAAAPAATQSVLVNSLDESGWQPLNRYPVQQAQFATPSAAAPSQFMLQPAPATTITTQQTPAMPSTTTTIMPAAPLTVVTPTTVQPYNQIGGICGCPTTAVTPATTTLLPATTTYAQSPYYGASGWSTMAASGPYLGSGVWGQPKAYMPDQPVRNFFRYVLP